jgi:signal transduction histidine kinase
MRLRTRLIAATLTFTFLLTIVLSLVFLSELLRERISQTESANLVLAHEVLFSTRTALQRGLAQNPPTDGTENAFIAAVAQALRTAPDLAETLNGAVRYSPDMQDAYVSTADGRVLVSSDPALEDRSQPHRRGFTVARTASLLQKRELLFGRPETLDISLPLQRNGQPFLAAHIGIRSTFLRNAYAPWLHDALLVCAFALGGSLLIAAMLAAAALRPIEQIGRELETISARGRQQNLPSGAREGDAVERVTSTISRLDQQIRTSEQTRTEMATNLNSMLQTLKDGVVLFTADLRVAMAGEAVANFLPAGASVVAGTQLTAVFPSDTAIGGHLADLLGRRQSVSALPVLLEDGRTIALSLNCFTGEGMGALLMLHDVAAQEELEREIEVSRRLASIGRLTAGVGHEVKNPINAMVVHLELLRGKLAQSTDPNGAQRHVEVLASEMSRLDRVVQALADFSRPIDPRLREQDLVPIVNAVLQLISGEAESEQIRITVQEDHPGTPIMVLCDAELMRQALLNIALNAMQAMPGGGDLRMHLTSDRHSACLSMSDSGGGISPEQLPRIFDLYFTTKSSGSGIGLAMTYRIVQLHGGIIDVKSESDSNAANHGTTFTLRMPLAGRPALSAPRAVSV